MVSATNEPQPLASNVIQASVAATKPRFTEIGPQRIAALIGGTDGGVVLSNVRGGGANAGASSGIVVFDATIGGETRGYVLRYAPMNNPHRIFLDYRIPEQATLQHKLAQAGLPVPDTFWVDPDGSILGHPGFVMERIEGVVANASPFAGGPLAEADRDERNATIDSILATLGEIHAVEWRPLQVEECVCRAAGRTPLERYINWFWQTAEWVAEPASLERLDAVRRWLFANQPTHHPDDCSIVHGDPGLGNYILRDGQVAAAIDWELSGIVHPAYDVAMQCLANDFYRASSPHLIPIIPSDDEWIARYEKASGRRLDDVPFYIKAATLPLLTVHLSMRRTIPPEHRAMHAEMTEATWAVAEAR